ncbi:MAG: hypothetical protein E3J64_03355 [Anaerolineales bacterium]|nr:MAG: hypothetical protein E3J64_03355 [Anaerolineales bacterium]
MEDEFDLRGYVEVLLRGWKWILGAAVLAGAAALAVSLLSPPTYEASALVIVTEPRYQLQLDPRFETTESWLPAYEAFPTLAMSDGILQNLVDSHVPSPEAGIAPWSLCSLSDALQAVSQGPSLVVLKATACSAEDAAGIANAWADRLAESGFRLFREGLDEVESFEAQVASAQTALDEAEASLIAFEGINRTPILEAELGSLCQTLDDGFSGQRGIDDLLQNIQGLREQLALQPAGYATGLAEELAALLLQIDAFDAGASAAIQLQIDSSQPLVNRSVDEQVAFLDTLIDTLEAKSSEIGARLAELEAPILALQRELEVVTAEADRLARTRDLARETHTLVAQKLEEARVSTSVEGSLLRVGSYAAVPGSPESPRVVSNTALAGVLGLMVGVCGVLVVDWWQTGEDKSGDRAGREN